MVIFVICKLWVLLDSLKLGLKSGILLKTNLLFKITIVSVFFLPSITSLRTKIYFRHGNSFLKIIFLWIQFQKFI